MTDLNKEIDKVLCALREKAGNATDAGEADIAKDWLDAADMVEKLREPEVGLLKWFIRRDGAGAAKADGIRYVVTTERVLWVNDIRISSFSTVDAAQYHAQSIHIWEVKRRARS